MKRAYRLVVVVILIYLSMAFIVYRFRHPEQTETELILNIFDALTFK
jgi:membrane-anchored glycerophosphoryl diester phosphodiesterase (GDPDase)